MPEKIASHLNQNTPLVTAINSWEMYLADQGRSPNTIKAFLSDVRLLTTFLPEDATLGKVTTKELNRYFEWMEKERDVPCSPKTLARRITAVKSLFRWLHKFGALVVDPAEKVAQRSAISPIPTVLTPKEYDETLLAADRHRRASKPDARPYALVYLLLSTGIKKSETLGIKLEHLELDSPNGPQVFIKYATPANRYKERKITLPEDWIPAYEEYAAQYKPQEKLFPWSQRRLEYLLEDISNEAGLNKHLSFDMCRWTCALNDYRAGVEPDAIRQKLGVSKIQWRELFIKLQKLARNKG
ncbi:MAG TPA: site-specific integrase [Anaerolineales bacterium]|nr:site-specific integrase [Anaerolineales bacterium]HNQ93403.1 site-specific integrase [Anaerolineales bacterium]HNS61622.1 site-specific integrase [Anaerolineales bacterium]